jgi:biotin carboxyl carrier protein
MSIRSFYSFGRFLISSSFSSLAISLPRNSICSAAINRPINQLLPYRYYSASSSSSSSTSTSASTSTSSSTADSSSSSVSPPRHLDLHYLTLPEVEMPNAKLLKWLVSPGSAVSSGDILAEIDSDLAEIEYKAQQNGYLAAVYVNPGESIEPDQIMGIQVASKEEMQYVLEEVKLNDDKKSVQFGGRLSHGKIDGPKSHHEHKTLAEKIGAL